MAIVKLVPVVNDKVIVRADSICAFCSVERFGASGRTGLIVPNPPQREFDHAVMCAPDHNILVRYDTPWSDGRGGSVHAQYFKADELLIIS